MFNSKQLLGALITVLAISGASYSNAAVLEGELGILDLEANGGINPATGVAWKAGDKYRFAFITSGTTLANSTDIATYNTFVQNQAAASTSFSNLGDATWKVIGATATTTVFTNTGTTTSGGESVFLLNNELFATDYADLWDGNAENRLDRDQNGNARPKNTPIWSSWNAVWTGLNGNGTTNSDPLGGDTGGNVRHGLMSDAQQMWLTRSSNAGGTYSLPVYALSDELTVTPEPGSLALLGLGGLLVARRRRG